MDLISAAISHFEYGISHDIFKEPVTSYARAAVNALCAQKSKGVEIDRVKNDPLALDELREMDGEPVWVVCLKPERYYEPPIGWRIIEKSIVGTFGVWNDSSCLAERDYGKTWLAYRRKPEEETV